MTFLGMVNDRRRYLSQKLNTRVRDILLGSTFMNDSPHMI